MDIEEKYKIVGQRDSSFDAVAGLLILDMILVHCRAWGGYRDSVAFSFLNVFSFFMPWFFLKGGFFFRNKKNIETIKNGFDRLIKPFLFWSAVGFVLTMISDVAFGGKSIGSYFVYSLKAMLLDGALMGNRALWFLLSLFVVRILCNIWVNRKLELWYLCGLSLCFSIFFYLVGLKNPVWMGNISLGLFFFALGARMPKNSPVIKYISCILYAIVPIFCMSRVDMRANKLIEGYYSVWIVWSIAAFFAINTFFSFFTRKMPSLMSPLVFLGRHSMSFYVAHWPVMTIVYIVEKQLLNITEKEFYMASLIGAEFLMILCVTIIKKFLQGTQLRWIFP